MPPARPSIAPRLRRTGRAACILLLPHALTTDVYALKLLSNISAGAHILRKAAIRAQQAADRRMLRRSQPRSRRLVRITLAQKGRDHHLRLHLRRAARFITRHTRPVVASAAVDHACARRRGRRGRRNVPRYFCRLRVFSSEWRNKYHPTYRTASALTARRAHVARRAPSATGRGSPASSILHSISLDGTESSYREFSIYADSTRTGPPRATRTAADGRSISIELIASTT